MFKQKWKVVIIARQVGIAEAEYLVWKHFILVAVTWSSSCEMKANLGKSYSLK